VFTQCPQCETVFRLSADVLGAAGGQVRCGRCGEVFDALKRLAEEPRMFAIGESTLEQEARAEHILESVDAEPRAPEETAFESFESTATEIASLEIQDVNPEDRWEEESPEVDAQAPELDAQAPEVDAQAPEFAPHGEHSLEFTLPPTELDRIFIEADPDAPLPDQAGEAQENSSLGAHAHVHAPAAEDLSAAFLEPERDFAPVTAPRGQRWPWVTAVIILSVLLAGQIVHRNRESLASRGPLGAVLRTLYLKLGNPLPVPASLSAYQLRQWGASGDATASGALRVRASILNTSGQMQPFPLLRVTLADRFGAHIGSREFEPAEYLGNPLSRLLSPGERADASVEIQDPGKNAEGFELDVCLRDADGKVHCASDLAP
jgi:predicted Zn finger-like uncharacterized protein